MIAHPLHVTVGDIFNRNIPFDCILIRDEACGGSQQIPLFVSKKKSRKTEYCNVDLLVLKDKKIRIIVEIEESDIKPTQICGKSLTSALSRYYIHESMNNQPIGMHNSVIFIQILDTSNLKAEKTSKYIQWKNLEKSINDILPVKDSKITEYRLFYGNEIDFNDKEKISKLISCIKQACK